MAQRTYRGTYKPKAKARKAGKIEIELTVTGATQVLAKAAAAKALQEMGEVASDYTGPRMVWLKNGSAAPQVSTEAEGTSGQGNNAADSESIEQATGDSWGALYGSPNDDSVMISDPALPADESGVSDEGCEPLNSAGSDLTVAEVEAEPLTIEQQVKLINAKVSALGIGERLRLENVPAEVYHPSIGWGSTRVKDYIKSPALAKAGIDGHMEKKPTKSMRIGTAYHAASLEPDFFRQEYTQGDDMPINQAEYDDVIRMRDATLKSVGYLLQGGAAEVSYWYRVSNELVIKCRIDYELPRLALDLKSAADVSDEGIVSAVDRFGYALQQEHYILASGCGQFAFLFQQNAAPWLTSLPVQLDDDLVEFAQLKLEKTYREIEQSEANDHWPVNRSADDGGVQTLVVGLKGWKRRELEELRIGA